MPVQRSHIVAICSVTPLVIGFIAYYVYSKRRASAAQQVESNAQAEKSLVEETALHKEQQENQSKSPSRVSDEHSTSLASSPVGRSEPIDIPSVGKNKHGSSTMTRKSKQCGNERGSNLIQNRNGKSASPTTVVAKKPALKTESDVLDDEVSHSALTAHSAPAEAVALERLNRLKSSGNAPDSVESSEVPSACLTPAARVTKDNAMSKIASTSSNTEPQAERIPPVISPISGADLLALHSKPTNDMRGADSINRQRRRGSVEATEASDLQRLSTPHQQGTLTSRSQVSRSGVNDPPRVNSHSSSDAHSSATDVASSATDSGFGPFSNGLSDLDQHQQQILPLDQDSGALASAAGPIDGSSNTNIPIMYKFDFPAHLVGMLIGTHGRNVKQLQQQSGAHIWVEHQRPGFTGQTKICVIEGTPASVDCALDLMKIRFPELDLGQLSDTAVIQPITAMLQPNTIAGAVGVSTSSNDDSSASSPSPLTSAPLPVPIPQLRLPQNTYADVCISSMFDAGHIYVQQPTHPYFRELEKLTQRMNSVYADPNAPRLPEQTELIVGAVCAAPWFDNVVWCRALVLSVDELSGTAVIRYVDHGSTTELPLYCLRQIRSDFLNFPFQACDCYLANVQPLADCVDFSVDSAEFLRTKTEGCMLLCWVHGYASDNKPLVEIFLREGHEKISINHLLVENGFARWAEVDGAYDPALRYAAAAVDSGATVEGVALS